MIKTEQIVVIENAKLKQLKLLYNNNNALCDTFKLFPLLTLETWSLRLSVTKFSDLDGSVSICPKVLCAFFVH